jgi:toxin YoeB
VKLVFRSAAWTDYVQWQAEDRAILARINLLIGECLRHPFTGTGRPEPLKRNLTGWWSRRIDREHRLVYRVTGKDEAQALEVLSCRYHY